MTAHTEASARTNRWDRFWFEPVSTASIAVFRIAYGVLVALWSISVLFDARAFYSSAGLFEDAALRGNEVTLLELADSPGVAIGAVVLLFAAGICVALGFGTRVAAFVVWLLLMSLRRRNGLIVNGGDGLLRHMAFFLVMSNAGAALSLDRWRKHRGDSFWQFPRRAPWGQRLIQIQISVVYLFTLWLKIQGDRWVDGTAVSDALKLGDLVRLELPDGLTDSLLVANLMTYGTLVVELALAILIWHRPARPYVIAAGIALHLFIEVTMSLGFFSLVMITSYLTFVPEDAMERFVDRVRLRRTRAPAPA